jgi:hypothetical protein
MHWDRVAETAREAFRRTVNQWIGQTRIEGGVVRGPDAEIVPGSLKSTVHVKTLLVRELISSGASGPVADAIARELHDAWSAWSEGFRMSLPGAFPQLAAVPGPYAGPTPSAEPAYPLSRGVSTGEFRLTARTLGPRLRQALAPFARAGMGSMEIAFDALARWVEMSFRGWKMTARLGGVMGKGPAPGYAPPYVPVFPVLVGDASTVPTTAAILGPPFGLTGT